MTVAELRQEGHRSLPRNTLLAQVFYYGELLEKWGTGTSRMITLCQNHGIPEPEFSAHPDWFSVTFAKDFYTDERLLALMPSDRQVQAVRYVREHGAITNKEYRELTSMSPRAALRELTDLCTREVLVKQGTTGRNTVYLLNKIKPAKHATNPKKTRHFHAGVTVPFFEMAFEEQAVLVFALFAPIVKRPPLSVKSPPQHYHENRFTGLHDIMEGHAISG